MAGKLIIKKELSSSVVFDYEAKEFPLVIAPQAEAFVLAQSEEASDFKVSDLTAEQSGISELQNKRAEDLVEEQAFERLKEVEERAYKEAYELGLIEGTEKAFQDRRSEFEQKLSHLDEILLSFEQLKDRMVEENEVLFARMVSLIASRIAMKEIEADKELVLKVITNIIEDVQTVDDILLKVSPDDYMFVQNSIEKLGRNMDFLKKVKIEPSDDVRSGGCVLETQFGVIDASVEQRFENVWKAIQSKQPALRQERDDGEGNDDKEASGPELSAEEVEAAPVEESDEEAMGDSEDDEGES